MKSQYTSKRNPCPICANTHGCRIFEDLVLCLRGSNPQDAPPGFRFSKALRNGMGGLFARGKQSEYDEQRQQRRDEQQRQRKQELARKRAKLLPVEERDKQYKLILQYRCTELSASHQAHLRDKRGLEQPEIDWLVARGWLRSWQAGAIAPHGATGVAGITGEGELVNLPGFAIAALDPQGRYTGAQLATLSDNPDRLPKYLWLSGEGRGGVGPQLPNGELPLFSWRHPDTQTIREVWLTEGALKSLLTALFLWRSGIKDIAVIGTAAGARYGSKTLSAYLQKFDTKQVRLLPDAGAIANRLIRRANRDTIKLLRRHRYTVQVGWWGQHTKGSSPDIDELLADGGLDRIHWLRFEQYESGEPTVLEEPDAAAYAVHVKQEQEEGRVEEAIAARQERKLQRQIGNLLLGKPIKSILSKIFKPFPNLDFKIQNEETQILRYIPGGLPSPDQYRAMGSPKISFRADQRRQILREARQKGWHDVLDTSGAGSGKSHAAGLLTPETLGVDRLWYFSAEHRNPTVDPIERNYGDLTVRHNGLVTDPNRLTPLGNPHISWPKEGQEANIQGNCFRTADFHKMQAKGFFIEPGGENPICASCPYGFEKNNFIPCLHSAGAGYGYRGKRWDDLESRMLRLHPDSAPDPREIGEKDGEEVRPAEIVAFWDEAGKLIKGVSALEVGLRDIDRKWAEIEGNLPDIHLALANPRIKLRQLISREIKQPLHGWGNQAILDHLGEYVEGVEELIAALAAEEVRLEDVFQPPDELDNLAQVSPQQRRTINRILNQQGRTESLDRLDEVPSLWLIPFLQIWAGLEQGALSIKNGTLTIYRRNPRHSELAAGIGCNFYMDATLSPCTLGLLLDKQSGDILWVEQESDDYANLKIVWIDIDRHIGGKLSASLTQRTHALTSALHQKHPDIAVLGHKAWAQEQELDGWWFHHNRGSNDFESLSAIALIGTPYGDIGAFQAEYIALTGDWDVSRDAPGFSRWVREKTEAEQIQGVGRLRANRRSEQVTAYIIGNYNPEFLLWAYPGCEIVRVEPWEICPLAGTAHQQNWWHITQAIGELKERGVKITQQAIAQISGVAQSTISFLARGGLKKIIETCIKVPNRAFDKICRSLDADQRLEAECLARDYYPILLESDLPPVELAKELFTTHQVYGGPIFWASLEALPSQIKAKLSALLISLCPSGDEMWQHPLVAGGASC